MLVSLSAWGLGWGQQQWGRAFNPPPVHISVSDAGCRDVETLLSRNSWVPYDISKALLGGPRDLGWAQRNMRTDRVVA